MFIVFLTFLASLISHSWTKELKGSSSFQKGGVVTMEAGKMHPWPWLQEEEEEEEEVSA